MPSIRANLVAFAVLGSIAFAPAAFAQWRNPPAPGPGFVPNVAAGKTLYVEKCAVCHGSSGQGEFQWRYRPLGAPALDSSGRAWHHEDAQLLSMILDKPVPDSRMPPWREVLSQEDALDLIAYIKSLWTPYIRDNCQGARHMRCAGRG